MGVIVAESQCSVIPVFLDGTYQVLPMNASWLRLHPVNVSFGAPIDFREDIKNLEGKELYKHISQTVMDRIADLRRVEQSATSEL